MTAAPTQASAEALATSLNAILDRSCDPAGEADKAIAALLRIALPEDGVATPGGAHLPYHFNDLGVSNLEGAESISTGLFRPVSNLFGTACSLFVLV